MIDSTPYVVFDGNCAEAMQFYKTVLGGELVLLKHSDAPMPSPPGMEHRVMHARLSIDGKTVLFASDEMVGTPYPAMQGFFVALSYPGAAEGKRVFETLTAGGQAFMAYGETFWAEGFGMGTDRFGMRWMINGAPKPMG
jgi:PhnB protein